MYTELLDILGNHLNHKPLVVTGRFKLHRSNHKDDEMPVQYLAELNIMAECSREVMWDRFIYGLRSEAAQKQLLTLLWNLDTNAQQLRGDLLLSRWISVKATTHEASKSIASSKGLNTWDFIVLHIIFLPRCNKHRVCCLKLPETVESTFVTHLLCVIICMYSETEKLGIDTAL